MHTYICLYGEFCLSSGRFLSGVFWPGFFCLEGFVRGGFCSSPLLSEFIRYNRKLNIIHNFRFHMYGKYNLKSVTSHALLPFPLSQTITSSLPPTPLERD